MNYNNASNMGYELNEVDINSGAEDYLDVVKNLSFGYNKIWRNILRSDGKPKRTKIEFYTTGGVGSNIKNAETGEYYVSKVGTVNENYFFKVIVATGECNKANGSTTLFYTSPQNYMSHMHCNVTQSIINNWEIRRNALLNTKVYGRDTFCI